MPNGVHHRQCCVTRETYLTFLLLLNFQSTQLFALKTFKFYLKEFPLVQLDLRDACYAFTLFSIPQLFFLCETPRGSSGCLVTGVEKEENEAEARGDRQSLDFVG